MFDARLFDIPQELDLDESRPMIIEVATGKYADILVAAAGKIALCNGCGLDVRIHGFADFGPSTDPPAGTRVICDGTVVKPAINGSSLFYTYSPINESYEIVGSP